MGEVYRAEDTSLKREALGICFIEPHQASREKLRN